MTRPVEALAPNRLVIHIQPDEGISLSFSAKIPGPQLRLGDVNMHFDYDDYFGERPTTGYERLLYDAMLGDATLFQRADMVEAGWSRGAAHPRRLEGPAAAQIPQLRRGQLGTGRSRGADGPRRAGSGGTETEAMGLTRDHVVWAYRILLDRDPENEDVIRAEDARLPEHPRPAERHRDLRRSTRRRTATTRR